MHRTLIRVHTTRGMLCNLARLQHQLSRTRNGGKNLITKCTVVGSAAKAPLPHLQTNQ